MIDADISKVADNEENSNSEGEQCGVPTDEQQSYTKKKQKRAAKAKTWLADTASVSVLLIWYLVSSLMMKIHFHLFKHGKLKSNGALTWINFRTSPAVRLLEELSNSLHTTNMNEHYLHTWALLVTTMGPEYEWKPRFREMAFCAIITTSSQVWRRLVIRFRSWPWRLGLAVDPTLSEADRRGIIAEMLNTNDCCRALSGDSTCDVCLFVCNEHLQSLE